MFYNRFPSWQREYLKKRKREAEEKFKKEKKNFLKKCN